MFAALTNQKLYSVNCHLHMETSDFLGGLRPIRQRSSDQVCVTLVVASGNKWKQKITIINDFSFPFPFLRRNMMVLDSLSGVMDLLF